MMRTIKIWTLIALLAILLPQWGAAATFYATSAKLAVGEKIDSNSTKNRNRTRFLFTEIITNPKTKAKAAFLQWAPLMPKAKGYRNGSLVDQKTYTRLWINGIWFTITFDGKFLHID